MTTQRVFVAYAPEDAAQGAGVIEALRAFAMDPLSDDGIIEPSEQNIDAHLTAQIESCDTYVVLLSPGTHASSRLIDATNIAYLLWLQQRIRFFVPVVLSEMGEGDYARLLYRTELDPDGTYFRRRFTLIDGRSQQPSAIAEAILATVSSRANEAALQALADEKKRVAGTIPNQEVLPKEERERGVSFGAGSQPSPARIEPNDMDDIPTSRQTFSDSAPGGVPVPQSPTPLAAPPPAPSAAAPVSASEPAGDAASLYSSESSVVTDFRDAAAPDSDGPGAAVDVTGTAYYPKEVAPREWENLLVYLALDTPQALAAVAADAAERLVRKPDAFRPATAQGLAQLKRGARLTIVPAIPGFECNPPSITARWEEDVQRHEFRVRSTGVSPGQAVNGNVSIFAGGILFADIPLSIFVRQAGGRSDIPGGFASYVARAYRKVFASYSHNDADIVRMCRTAAEAMGDRYLMDVTLLRSGQQWNDALMAAIAEADLFQLFWSPAAAASDHVQNEWRYALQLLPARTAFIRPVYWSAQPYKIPTELATIHFERVDLFRMGIAKPQPFWRSWFGQA